MTQEPDHPDHDLDGHGPTELLVRRTLTAVAARTVVADRPIDDLGPTPPTRPDVAPAQEPIAPTGTIASSSGARRWRLLVAAAAVVLALVLGALGLRRDDIVTETATGPATTTDPAPAQAAPPSGAEAWLLPPQEWSGLQLALVSGIRSFGSSSAEPNAPTGTIRRTPVRIGSLTFDTTIFADDTRTTRYRFEDPAAPREQAVDPPLRITTVTSTMVDVGSVRLSGDPVAVARAGDFSVVDAGEMCAPDGQRQIVSPLLVTMGPCRHLYLVWSGDLTLAIDADPGRPLGDLVADLQIVTLVAFRQALAGIDGVEESVSLATAPPPTTPPPTAVSIPDTVLCQSWANVLRHAAENDDIATNAAMFEDMQAMAAVAPPALAADLQLLTELWSQTPVPPESAEVMGRVMQGAAAECGFWNLEPG